LGSRGNVEDSILIEFPVVMYDVEGAVFLFDHKCGGTVVGRRCHNVALLQVIRKVLIKYLLFVLGEWVDLAINDIGGIRS